MTQEKGRRDMKYKRNNSIIASNNFNNNYTFDDTLNINNFILENNSIKNINYNNTNKMRIQQKKIFKKKTMMKQY